MNKWVIMNTQEKLKLSDVIAWWESPEGVIIHCIRESNRGKVEDIYILGALGTYIQNGRNVYNYITDTGNGYGGTGKLYILNYMTFHNGMIMSVKNPNKINEIKKFPLWVFK